MRFVFIIIFTLYCNVASGLQYVTTGDYHIGRTPTGAATVEFSFSWATYPSSSDDDVIPGCTNKVCYYGPVVLDGIVFTDLGGGIGHYPVKLPVGATWGDASRIYSREYGSTGTLNNSGYTPPICAAYVAFLREHGTYDAIPNSAIVRPADYRCVTPIKDFSCSMREGNKDISHGSLAPNEINSHTARTNLSINCEKSSDLKISLLPRGGVIMKSNQIESNLTIAGSKPNRDGYYYVNLNEGGNVIEVISTLTAIGEITAGNFSGSQTLIIEMQ